MDHEATRRALSYADAQLTEAISRHLPWPTGTTRRSAPVLLSSTLSVSLPWLTR
jgi:hypothetical protein